MVSVEHAIINAAWAALAAKAGAEFALAMAKSAADNTFLGRTANFLTGLPSGATNGAKVIVNTFLSGAFLSHQQRHYAGLLSAPASFPLMDLRHCPLYHARHDGNPGSPSVGYRSS